MRYEHKTTVQLLVTTKEGGPRGLSPGTSYSHPYTAVPMDHVPPDDSGQWHVIHTMTRQMFDGPEGIFVWERQVENEGEDSLVEAVKAVEATLDGVSGHLDDLAAEAKTAAEALSGIYRDMPTANQFG